MLIHLHMQHMYLYCPAVLPTVAAAVLPAAVLPAPADEFAAADLSENGILNTEWCWWWNPPACC